MIITGEPTQWNFNDFRALPGTTRFHYPPNSTGRVDGGLRRVLSSPKLRSSMRQRYLVSLVALGSLALASLAVVTLTGQTPASTVKSGAAKAGTAVPRTPWGTPDLQGTWFVLYDVPLERSAANKDKPFLSDEEIAAANKAKETSPGRNMRSVNATQDVGGAYNAVFNSVLKTGKRTSMVIDPPDGKIPPLVAGAQGQGRGGFGRGAAVVARVEVQAQASTITQRPLPQSPRCLGVLMPFLLLNTAFAQGTVMQVVQSPKSMGIYDGRRSRRGRQPRDLYGRAPASPPQPPNSIWAIRAATGKGTRLVVERSTNFSSGQFFGSNIEDVQDAIERCLRAWTRPILKREITFIDPEDVDEAVDCSHRDGEGRASTIRATLRIFDSACHEGN